jgi:hypothetical protein
MVCEPRHGLAGVADFAGVYAIVADHAVLLEFVHGLGFIEAGGGEVVLEAVGYSALHVSELRASPRGHALPRRAVKLKSSKRTWLVGCRVYRPLSSEIR